MALTAGNFVQTTQRVPASLPNDALRIVQFEFIGGTTNLSGVGSNYSAGYDLTPLYPPAGIGGIETVLAVSIRDAANSLGGVVNKLVGSMFMWDKTTSKLHILRTTGGLGALIEATGDDVPAFAILTITALVI